MSKTKLYLKASSIFIFGILLLLLISCNKKTITHTSESTIERIRPVPVGFPPSLNSFDVTIECDKKTNLPVPIKKTFKTDKKTTTVDIAGNNLNITNKTDTVWIEVPCKDIEKTKDKEVEVRITVWPWWVVPLILYSIAITLVAGYLFLRKVFI
jgi:hypothetical protein